MTSPRPRPQPGEILETDRARAQRGSGLRLLLKAGAALALLWALGRLLAVVLPQDFSGAGGRTGYSYRVDGYRGALELARALGMRAEPKRSSYGRLPPSETSALVTLDPLPAEELAEIHAQAVDEAQARALAEWLGRGGHVLATPPARSVRRVAVLGAELELEDDDEGSSETVLGSALEGGFPPTEWSRARGELEWDEAYGGARELWSFPRGAGAQLAAPFLASKPSGLRLPFAQEAPPPDLQAFVDPVPSGWEVAARLDGRPFLLARGVQAGRVWLVASAWPFTNLALARHGTAGFVARLLGLASEGERALHFDEYAHGLWERRGWLFWMREDVLLYPALGLVLVALLCAWRGAQRFGPPAETPEPPRRAKEEFVLGIADVARRARRHRAAARALLDVYRARLAEHGLAEGEPGWARLESRARSSEGFDLSALRALARDADTLYRRQLEHAGLAGIALAEHAPPDPSRPT